MQHININNTDEVIAAIEAMFLYYFKCSFRDIEMIENKLYYMYDTSFHGSPHYQYKLITEDKDKIEIYKHLLSLRELLFKINKE